MPNLLQEPALNRKNREDRQRHRFKLAVFAVLISCAAVLLAALLFKMQQSFAASGGPNRLLTNSSSAATDP